RSTVFPYTTLFRSDGVEGHGALGPRCLAEAAAHHVEVVESGQRIGADALVLLGLLGRFEDLVGVAVEFARPVERGGGLGVGDVAGGDGELAGEEPEPGFRFSFGSGLAP